MLGDCNDGSFPAAMGMHLSNNNLVGPLVPVWTEVAGSAATEASLAGGGASTAETPTVSTSGGVQQVTYHALTAAGPVTITAWAYSSSGGARSRPKR